jgi:hypothetical protein
VRFAAPRLQAPRSTPILAWLLPARLPAARPGHARPPTGQPASGTCATVRALAVRDKSDAVRTDPADVQQNDRRFTTGGSLRGLTLVMGSVRFLSCSAPSDAAGVRTCGEPYRQAHGECATSRRSLPLIDVLLMVASQAGPLPGRKRVYTLQQPKPYSTALEGSVNHPSLEVRGVSPHGQLARRSGVGDSSTAAILPASAIAGFLARSL